MVRIDLHLLICTICATVLLPVQAEQPAPPTYERPVLVRVEGEIGPQLERFVRRKLQRAKALGCDLLIVEIDSPGGGLRETLNLCDELTALSGVHTVAYIPREALSGGAVVALACDEIVMAPTARIGDCGPIFLAEDFLFRHASEKIRSDLVARVRVLAEQNGHPPALAEAMVDHNVLVDRYRLPEGTEQFYTDRELAARPAVPPGERVETLPESGRGRFLELVGSRAAELGLASATVASRAALYEHYKLAPPLLLQANAEDTAVLVLNHWLMTLALIVIGLAALAYELSAPGLGIGGLTAGLCFLLFFWSRFLGGTSDWLEVLLFVAGIVFLAMELFVIPGFGAAGVMGIGLMLASIVLALQEFTLPATNAELATTLNSIVITLGASAACFVLCAYAMRSMESLPLFSRMMLKPPETVRESSTAELPKKGSAVKATDTIAVGDWGVATTLLRPSGKVQFGDTIVDVVSNGAFIQPGMPVRLIEMQGSRIVVEQADV
jgi:membrane-bound serine protease (ClpP class)